MKLRKLKKNKGYTFIEVLLAVFLFSVAMVLVMGTMVNTTIVKKRAQNSAQNLEDARFAMETMAKTLRGSKIFSCNGGSDADCTSGTITAVETFDYSQGKCIQYKFYSDGVYSTNGTGDLAGCSFSPSNLVPMIDNNNKIQAMSFNVVKPSATASGSVTILMEICSKYNKGDECVPGKSDNFPIQTTVSLRN